MENMKYKDLIVASYGNYTGESEDEYPTWIYVTDQYNGKLEDIDE